MKLLPEKWMPYAKSWTALIGVVLVTIATAWTGAPVWLPIAAAVVTAVGVYLTPNREAQSEQHDDNLRA